MGPSVALALAAGWCGVHLRTGTPWPDLAGWVAAVVVGLLAPGTVLVRAVRRSPAPLVEDLAWGSAAGCLVALAGWLVDRSLPWAPGPLVVGPLVVFLLALRPEVRRRVLARPEPGWGPLASLAAGAAVAVALVWMTATNLSFLPMDPGPEGVVYPADLLYQSALVGEFRSHLVAEYPMVSGEPLGYHWFLYAIESHLTTGTGVDPFGASLRLAPTTMVPAFLLLAGVVARRIAGRVAAAPVAMVLLAATDLALANRWGWRGSSVLGGAFSPVIGYWSNSPTQTLGWLAGVAALGTAVAWLRGYPRDRPVPVALVLPFFLLCLGAKSSQLPSLVCGVGLALAVMVLTRRWLQARRALALLVATAVLWLLATVLVYRGASHGVVVEPGGQLGLQVDELFPRFRGRPDPLIASLSAFLVVTVPLLPRLLGLAWLGARRAADPATWVTLGTAVAGFAAAYVVRHPAQSELYFLFSAYPLAVVGSAAGLTLGFEAAARWLQVPQRRLAPALAACAVFGLAAALLVARQNPSSWPITRWAEARPDDPLALGVAVRTQAGWYLWPTVQLGGVLVLGAVVALAALAVRRSRSATSVTRWGPARWAAAGVAALVAMALGTGAYGMSQTVGGVGSGTLEARAGAALRQAPATGVLPVTQDLVDGGRWLDARAGPDDVVAVNRACIHTRAWRERTGRCDAREFSSAGLGLRRSYVGGWAYANRNLAVAWLRPPPYREIAFWDPARLASEEQVFRRPTADLLSQLYDDGVRWAWADLRDGPVATGALDRLAEPAYLSEDLRIWRLRRPAAAAP